MSKKFRTLLALIVIVSLVLGDIASLLSLRLEALSVEGMTITQVRYNKDHQGFNVTGGSLVIMGSNLKADNFRFDVGGKPQKLGTLSSDSSESFLIYQLSDKEVNQFSGMIYAKSTEIPLFGPNMPYISKADKSTVNEDHDENLTVYGSNLNSINNVDFTATYGKGASMNNIVTGTAAPNSHTFVPKAPNEKGYQDIKLLIRMQAILG